MKKSSKSEPGGSNIEKNGGQGYRQEAQKNEVDKKCASP